MVSDASPTPQGRGNDREIYPSAALQLVAFEARFPTVPEFSDSEHVLAVFGRLREELPVLGPPPTALTFTSGAVGASFAPHLQQGIRALNRRKTLSATVAPNSLVVETSEYTNFESFLERIQFALDGLLASVRVAGIERLGLRYVNEIRVREVQRPRDWEGLISDALLGPTGLVGKFDPSVYQGSIEYEVSDDQRATMRYGALNGWVVDPNGPIRVRHRGDGPFFLVDIDSYWSAPKDEIPRFSRQVVIELIERLHDPVHDLFENAITERLRDEVLREGGDDV